MGRLVDGGASSARRGCLGMVGGEDAWEWWEEMPPRSV